jgi:hypothetical protein
MNATKTEYYAKNTTSMSDDDFYGRESALGVDLDACRRAAVREARRGYDSLVMGDSEQGKMEVRRAVYRLAVALGNQTIAQEYLWTENTSWLGNVCSAEEIQDRQELDRAVAREHPHPQLIAALNRIEGKLREMKSR